MDAAAVKGEASFRLGIIICVGGLDYHRELQWNVRIPPIIRAQRQRILAFARLVALYDPIIPLGGFFISAYSHNWLPRVSTELKPHRGLSVRRVSGFGRGEHGQTGLGNAETVPLPQRVNDPKRQNARSDMDEPSDAEDPEATATATGMRV